MLVVGTVLRLASVLIMVKNVNELTFTTLQKIFEVCHWSEVIQWK